MAQTQSPVEKARMVLAELRTAIEGHYADMLMLEEDVNASKQEIMEALQVADLVLSKTEIVPTGR